MIFFKYFLSIDDHNKNIISLIMTFLLLGIGNPGERYKNTRHNLGTLVLWQLIKLYDSQFNPQGNNYEFFYKDHKVVVQWTISYVNTTGNPMATYMNKNNIQPHQLMVFFDNLDLESGDFKYSYGFGTFGHNGLKSIKTSLGVQNYHRIGCGIGRPKHDDVSKYVLDELSSQEKEKVYFMAYDLYKNNILDKLLDNK
jgi:PTH1 family peptidyl-tRNA hydrolase